MPLQIDGLGQLRQTLQDHGMDLNAYGTGAAKSIGHLYAEIHEGECMLDIVEDRLTRILTVLCLNVESAGRTLVEDKQRFFSDGRERRRKLDSSAGEKFKPGETPEAAAARCVEEELPFLKGLPITMGESSTRKEESPSYPGLMTEYRTHRCSVSIPPEDVPDVIVVEPDKVVFYRWQH